MAFCVELRKMRRKPLLEYMNSLVEATLTTSFSDWMVHHHTDRLRGSCARGICGHITSRSICGHSETHRDLSGHISPHPHLRTDKGADK
ncbi:hypothetical protein TNCV_16971 [Trichonephila clavipes]|nr:hypothetical protein TNCV_16971 [Trichonephila clavipes]